MSSMIRHGYELVLVAAAVAAVALSLVRWFKPLRPALWSAALLFALSALLVARGNEFPWIGQALPSDSPTLDRAFWIGWWIAGALFSSSIFNYVVSRWIFPDDDQPRARKLLADLSAGLIYIIAGAGILNVILGPPLSGLLATSGIVAVVVGLALQSTLGDLFSGIALNIELPFRAGEWVTISGVAEGQVLEINWRATRLRTRVGDVVVVPNSVLAKSVLTNHYRPSRLHLAGAKATFGHAVDPQDATAIMLAAAADLPSALKEPPPTVFLVASDELGIVYELGFFIADYADAPLAESDARRRIWARAAERGVSLAVPRREVALSPPSPGYADK